uniref:Uncharacterized protein n=1 Tax=mine drainage metagenome TaxID=410659 RepID=E6PIU6_9ZZZZ
MSFPVSPASLIIDTEANEERGYSDGSHFHAAIAIITTHIATIQPNITGSP